MLVGEIELFWLNFQRRKNDVTEEENDGDGGDDNDNSHSTHVSHVPGTAVGTLEPLPPFLII